MISTAPTTNAGQDGSGHSYQSSTDWSPSRHYFLPRKAYAGRQAADGYLDEISGAEKEVFRTGGYPLFLSSCPGGKDLVPTLLPAIGTPPLRLITLFFM